MSEQKSYSELNSSNAGQAGLSSLAIIRFTLSFFLSCMTNLRSSNSEILGTRVQGAESRRLGGTLSPVMWIRRCGVREHDLPKYPASPSARLCHTYSMFQPESQPEDVEGGNTKGISPIDPTHTILTSTLST